MQVLRLIRLLRIGVVLAALVGPAYAQQQVTLTPAQMRGAAANAIVSGNVAAGYQLANALLQRNPNDIEALIIRARAARDLGRVDEAIVSARRAWSSARNSSEKFGASMVMAQALSTKGAKTRAQLWLRRAGQHAPTPEMKAIAVRDFRFVQRLNPWATEFSFSVSPSSNINNGSQRSTTQLFDLPFEFQLSGAARALSGIQYSLGFATRYRLQEDARQQNDLVLQFSHRTYTMSPEAKRLAPNARGSDFAFSSLGLSYVRRGFSSAGTTLPNQLEFTLGRTLYGQDPFMQYGRLSFTQNAVVAPGTFVFAGLSVEQQQSLSQRDDVTIAGLSVGTRISAPNRDQITVTLTGRRSHSNDASLDYRQTTLGLRYALAKPVAGMMIDMGVAVTTQNHDQSRFSRFGRKDDSISLDVTAVFTQVEYFGFSPSVTLRARRNKSTIGLYETEDLGFQVGIRSAF